MTVLMAFLTALIVSLALGPLLIPVLRRLKVQQTIRDDGPARHVAKAGTPTMGGLIFLPAWGLATCAWAGWSLPVFLVLAAGAGFGLLGFGDDYLKVCRRRSLGLRARQKILGQVVLSLSLAVAAVAFWGRGTEVELFPFGRHWDLGWVYYLFALLVMVASSNAVNLTDGLDGLAAGIAVLAAAAYTLIALWLGYTELAVAAAALAGSCAGFLVYNRHPARVFMGDTGALGIGAVLGALAVLTRTELLWLVVGGVYAWETLTVILQVAAYRIGGRRLWRMTPYHHHLELKGWPEPRVVAGLWLAAAVLAGLGVTLLVLGSRA
ncbi:MAG: phospho-N-acetylmuramoyl-pentapeptide-transferase [Clostridia bacterium]|jgi:phospho-N-acetylmuramoyl-pentapeptide-transferase|nr:phospho-N-acetylmuramoyl-pentapeptide-transferase [Clostridia bacterium]MDH7573305.1 phospho-N-acetylmuramoyl-pentapeptide-transferase [Clostridia bacterium]